MDLERALNSVSEKNCDAGGDHYRGGDGLMYCTKCHTPRQTRVQLFGRTLTPWCMCRCMTEACERENAARNTAEEQQRIEENRRKCFADRALAGAYFRTSAESTELNKVYRYCLHFDEMKARRKGLILCGSVGVGKTHAAACAANELTDRGYRVHMTDFSRIINTLWDTKNGRQSYLDGLNAYDLLIIDDLAAERDTDYASEIVMTVINSRYKSGLPLIVTTNLTARELTEPTELRKKRIYSRLCEMCLPIQYTDTADRRKMRMKQDYQECMKLIECGV